MVTATLRIAIPRASLLTANQRLHWRRKAERTKEIRTTAHVLALAQKRAPFADRVRCVVTIMWPNARRRDVHNLMPTIKAAVDGIVDAGWLTDDSDAFLEGPDLRVSDERCDKNVAVGLVFEFSEAKA